MESWKGRSQNHHHPPHPTPDTGAAASPDFIEGPKRHRRVALTPTAGASTLRTGFQVKLNWSWLDLVLLKGVASLPCPIPGAAGSTHFTQDTTYWDLLLGARGRSPEPPPDHVPEDTQSLSNAPTVSQDPFMTLPTMSPEEMLETLKEAKAKPGPRDHLVPSAQQAFSQQGWCYPSSIQLRLGLLLSLPNQSIVEGVTRRREL